MTNDESCRPVSLKPSLFGTAPEILMSMTAEEAIRAYVGVERTRTKDSVDPLVKPHYGRACSVLNQCFKAILRVGVGEKLNLDLLTQTLVIRGLAAASFEDDLVSIGEVNSYIATLYQGSGGFIDLMNSLGSVLSPYTEQFYVKKAWHCSMSESTSKRVAGYAAGTGIETYEIAAFIFLLSILSVSNTSIGGCIQDAVGIVETYRIYFKERLILVKAFQEIAELRILTKTGKN